MAVVSGNVTINASSGQQALSAIAGVNTTATYIIISAIKVGAKDGGGISVGETGQATPANQGYYIKLGEELRLVLHTGSVDLAQIFVFNPDAELIKVAVLAW